MNSKSHDIAKLYKIHGVVQGVGFRSFVYHRARSLGIHGYVQNEIDGTVTVLAEGSMEALLEFEKHLRVGPLFSHVTNVEIVDAPYVGYDCFEIR